MKKKLADEGRGASLRLCKPLPLFSDHYLKLDRLDQISTMENIFLSHTC